VLARLSQFDASTEGAVPGLATGDAAAVSPDRPRVGPEEAVAPGSEIVDGYDKLRTCWREGPLRTSSSYEFAVQKDSAVWPAVTIAAASISVIVSSIRLRAVRPRT
jgi:hypothetical protein